MSVLKLTKDVSVSDSTLVLAFTGWMDGGNVSTGTVERLVEMYNATESARIDPEPFYLYNFPGSMELSSLFRPHIDIVEGIIESVQMPENRFYCHAEGGLVFFVGKEPNLRWKEFGDAILEYVTQLAIDRIIFVGSFGGTVPHTREPRLYATSYDEELLYALEQLGIKKTNYSGPGSFTSYLMTRANCLAIEMFSIIAEIPSYLHGRNPVCIEAVTRRLAKLLKLPMDVERLRSKSTNWELDISKMVENDPELSEKVRELENAYDNELIGLDSDTLDRRADESDEFTF